MAVSDWTLEQLHAGTLTPSRAAALRQRLADDPALRARLDALVVDDAATLAALPPARVAAEVERRRHLAASQARVARDRGAWSGGAWRIWGPALALASIAAFLALRAPLVERGAGGAAPATDGGAGSGLAASSAGDQLVDRAKGGDSATIAAGLALFRQADGRPERLSDGALARAGDLLTVAIRLERGAHCAIVSIDGRGTVTRHAPETGDAPVHVDPGKPYLPEHAYELDDAPGFERFLLVCGDAPFSVEAVVARARALASHGAAAARDPLALDAAMRVHSLLLRKPAAQPEAP